MRRKVTFGRCFRNNFCSARNSKTRPHCCRKISFRAWIWTQILYVYVGNRKSYGCFYLALGVTRYLNSNSGPIEGHKSGSPTFCSRIWVWNIFPMSQGQSSQNLVFGQKFVAGKLSRDLAGLKVFWKASFGHRFSHKIWTFRNFRRRAECVGKHSFWDRIWTQILLFFVGNQDSYCRYSFAPQVTKNTDFDYDRIGGREYTRLMLCS